MRTTGSNGWKFWNLYDGGVRNYWIDTMKCMCVPATAMERKRSHMRIENLKSKIRLFSHFLFLLFTSLDFSVQHLLHYAFIYVGFLQQYLKKHRKIFNAPVLCPCTTTFITTVILFNSSFSQISVTVTISCLWCLWSSHLTLINSWVAFVSPVTYACLFHSDALPASSRWASLDPTPSPISCSNILKKSSSDQRHTSDAFLKRCLTLSTEKMTENDWYRFHTFYQPELSTASSPTLPCPQLATRYTAYSVPHYAPQVISPLSSVVTSI